ncbi:hypothetical protein TG4357_03345 [Thalassovita gelatinovora]|uniref:Transcriptional regulator n=1 Tax=Thalassovita gelatinovora TaxID=53501 RepID=A0A0P1FJ57_THAGE|nr:hypothetical protein [Thalassovita gelatinovora]QIZ81585.1 hypothetical protein HFZ77_14415 [Thalassovita gelatinovora]CUH68021.1 hypothetical protein TG4357_03345 [Thalassovita gelatinovora]SEQ27653.1 hypothetical protein SAMN04488043_104216 [Thalassovita gelatinovora]
MSIETPIEKACRCWGDDMPDWIDGLARACMDSSQNKVAKEMGYSAALVSNVLAHRYPGDMERVEAVYRGVFEKAVVDCPALGELGMDVCRNWRRKAKRLNPANSQNVMMFRACRSCPLNQEEKP